MKVKVKFDATSIKKWLLEHGEKVAFGAIMLVFVMLTYAAVRHEVLDATKQPDQLKKMAADVTTHVTSSTWDEKREGVQLVEYDKRAHRELISDKGFKLPVPFDPPLADPKLKRGTPELHPMEEWRIASGSGIFSLKPDKGPDNKPQGQANVVLQKGGGLRPGADSVTKAQAWAVITALVPIEKQTKEFARVFERAMIAGKDGDVPRYAGVEVERAEIDDAHPDKLDWQKLPGDAVAAFEQQWEIIEPEVIAADCVDPALTAHLGPLVGVDWDASVTHPKIPLAQAGTNQPQQAVEVPKAAAPADAAGDGNPFFAAARAPAGPAKQPAADAASASATKPAMPPYRLLRIFDYSVKPDHQYRYRVTVGIWNPNYQIGPQYLETPEAANDQFLRIGPGPATEPIAIPRGHRVLAGAVKMAKPEPSATLMLIAIDEKAGIEASTEFPVQRGSVANTVKSAVNARDPRTTRVVELSDVNFKSGLIVLDIRGGRPLKKETSPGEMLLLDDHGNLIVRDELADESAYANAVPPEAPDSDGPAKSDTIPGPGADSGKTKKSATRTSSKAGGR